jgi:hypothetical protein
LPRAAFWDCLGNLQRLAMAMGKTLPLSRPV